MGTILTIRRCIMMFSHREIYNISGIYNRVDVFMEYAKLLLYSMGKQHGVGVCYIKASLPIYVYRRDFVWGYTKSLLYYKGMHIQLV